MFVNNFNSTDPQRPSFFEMFAQQQLISTMKPALRYLFSVSPFISPFSSLFPPEWLISFVDTSAPSQIIALRSPSWNKAVDYCDEIFHSAQLLVDGFYLSNNSATFSENFYLLHRKFLPPFDPRSVLDRTSPLSSATTSSNVGDNGSPSPLSNKMIASSLLFSVVVPYLKTKADNWYRSHSTSSHFEDVGEVDRVIDFDPDFIVGGNAGAGGIFGFQNPDARGQDGAADGRGGLRAAAAAAAAHFGAHVDHSLRQRLVQSLKRMLLSGYPFFHALYEGLSFVYMLLYMFDYSRYWSFGQHLQKYETRRMTLKELVRLSPPLSFSLLSSYFFLLSLSQEPTKHTGDDDERNRELSKKGCKEILWITSFESPDQVLYLCCLLYP